MDKLDKLTIVFVTVMTLYAAVLIFMGHDQSDTFQQSEKRRGAVRQNVINPDLNNKIQLAKKLLTQGNLKKTELLVNTLVKEFPFEGGLYILKGDILMRRQQSIAAMYEYKEAVGLNSDFLDKKTTLFQGKKIKITVDEALTAIESGLQQHPHDDKLKKDRETVYYMKRKLAGGCG